MQSQKTEVQLVGMYYTIIYIIFAYLCDIILFNYCFRFLKTSDKYFYQVINIEGVTARLLFSVYEQIIRPLVESHRTMMGFSKYMKSKYKIITYIMYIHF